ncbi:MAG: CNP1-like family protein [Brachymonas sp.]|nr:CNP1-like family protein [Brachymonas sp.]
MNANRLKRVAAWQQPWRCAWALLAGVALAGAVQAQPTVDDPAILWREHDVPPAPALSTAHMVQIDMPLYSEVRVGVDLNSIQVNSQEGVVRYVTLVQGRDGALSAYYQGVHCNSFQGRTYARYRFDAPTPGWENVDEPWQELKEKKSHYARLVAQAGACENYVPAPNTQQARRLYARNAKWQGVQWPAPSASVVPAASAAQPAAAK